MHAEHDAAPAGAVRWGTAKMVSIITGIVAAGLMVVWIVSPVRDVLAGQDDRCNLTPSLWWFDCLCAILEASALSAVLVGCRQTVAAELRRKPSTWWCVGCIVFATGFSTVLLGTQMELTVRPETVAHGSSDLPHRVSFAGLVAAGTVMAVAGGFVAFIDMLRCLSIRRAEREADRQALMGAAPPTGTNHEPSRVELS